MRAIEPESAPSEHGTVFIAGCPEKAAVHSEPNITHPRLFVAIAPGSKSQIKDRHERQLAFEKGPEYQEILKALQKS